MLPSKITPEDALAEIMQLLSSDQAKVAALVFVRMVDLAETGELPSMSNCEILLRDVPDLISAFTIALTMRNVLVNIGRMAA